MNTDTIADCFSRLRNASKAKLETVSMPYSKVKESVLSLLKREGFIIGFEVEDLGSNRKNLNVFLKFDSYGAPVLEHISRVSTPGHRIYSSVPSENQKIRQGLGFRILSTSKGVLSDRQAIAMKVGGEVIGEVW